MPLSGDGHHIPCPRPPVIMDYTPDNTRKLGATPVWLSIDCGDDVCRELKHVFVTHQTNFKGKTDPISTIGTIGTIGTKQIDVFSSNKGQTSHDGPWTIQLDAELDCPALVIATASDPGSDDLTFDWSFGETSTVFNNGIGADPALSPEVKTIIATQQENVAYLGEPITLAVTDDDGGVRFITI